MLVKLKLKKTKEKEFSPLDRRSYGEAKEEELNSLPFKRASKDALISDMEATSYAMEELAEVSKVMDDAEFEDFMKGLEGDRASLKRIKRKNARLYSLLLTLRKNRDIADYFASRLISLFLGKKKGNLKTLLKEYWRIRKDKKLLKLIEALEDSRYGAIIDFLSYCDPLEIEYVLKKLLPALISSGIDEEALDTIIALLSDAVERGPLTGSEALKEMVELIISFIYLFGPSKKLIEALGDIYV